MVSEKDILLAEQTLDSKKTRKIKIIKKISCINGKLGVDVRKFDSYNGIHYQGTKLGIFLEPDEWRQAVPIILLMIEENDSKSVDISST